MDSISEPPQSPGPSRTEIVDTIATTSKVEQNVWKDATVVISSSAQASSQILENTKELVRLLRLHENKEFDMSHEEVIELVDTLDDQVDAYHAENGVLRDGYSCSMSALGEITATYLDAIDRYDAKLQQAQKEKENHVEVCCSEFQFSQAHDGAGDSALRRLDQARQMIQHLPRQFPRDLAGDFVKTIEHLSGLIVLSGDQQSEASNCVEQVIPNHANLSGQLPCVREKKTFISSSARAITAKQNQLAHENQSLTQLRDMMAMNLKAYAQTIKTLTDDNAQTASAEARLTDEFAHITSNYTHLIDKNVQLTSLNAEITHKCKIATAEIETLQEVLRATKRELESKKDVLLRKQKELEALDHQLQAEFAKHKELTRQKEELQLEVREYMVRVEKANGLERKYQAESERCNALVKQISQLSERTKKSDALRRIVDNELQDKSDELTNATAENIRLNTRNSVLQQQVDSMKSEQQIQALLPGRTKPQATGQKRPAVAPEDVHKKAAMDKRMKELAVKYEEEIAAVKREKQDLIAKNTELRKSEEALQDKLIRAIQVPHGLEEHQKTPFSMQELERRVRKSEESETQGWVDLSWNLQALVQTKFGEIKQALEEEFQLD